MKSGKMKLFFTICKRFCLLLFIIQSTWNIRAQITTDKNIMNPFRNVLTDQICPGTVVFKEDFGGNLPSDKDVAGGTPTGLTGVGACTPSTMSAILGIPISNPPTAAQLAQIEAAPGWGTCLVYAGSNNGIPEVKGYDYSKASPGQGQYSIRKQSGGHSDNTWVIMDDHTYSDDLTRGYLIQFDAGAVKTGNDQFFEKEISVCSGTRLSFSAWIANTVKNLTAYPLKPNLAFTLKNTTDNSVIAQFTTQDVGGSGQWRQFGFDFQVPDGVSKIKLYINNNVSGSSDNGNDFVLDDIQIRLCNAPITITSNAKTCISDVPIQAVFVNNNNITGGQFVYRWEYSTDSINWLTYKNDSTISMGTNATFIDSIIVPSAEATTHYYRLVAGSPGTIGTTCRMESAPYRPNVPQGNISFSSIPDQCIYNASVDLSGFVSPVGGTFSGTGVSGTLFNPSAAGEGKHKITYESKNCVASQNIIVHPKPSVTFGPLYDVPYDTSAFPMYSGNPKGGKYSGTGVNDSIFSPAISGTGTFTLTYTYSDNYGCTNSKTATIKVIAKNIVLKVPNVFTPNNDGANDAFKVYHEGDFSSFSILIFNRWGNKIYQSKDVNFEWDGKNYSDGVYYWVIKATGKDNQKLEPTGTLTLLR